MYASVFRETLLKYVHASSAALCGLLQAIFVNAVLCLILLLSIFHFFFLTPLSLLLLSQFSLKLQIET